MLIDSQLEFFMVMLGLWRIGAVPVVINQGLSNDKIYSVMTGAHLSRIFTTEKGADRFDRLDCQRVPSLEKVIDKKYDDPDVEVSEDELAAILYTSGSTGMPKGVMLSHKVLGGNCLAAGRQLKLTERDRWLFNIPFTFTSAICHVWTGLMAGATVIALDQMCFPAQFPALIESFKATGVGGSPIQIRWLTDSVERPGEALQGLKKVMTSGDALRGPTWRAFLNTFPHIELYHVYGMTELGGRFCCLDPSRSYDKIGSAGKPMPGLTCTIRCTSTGRELPSRTTGEVYASGDLLMDGYYGLAEETARTLTPYGLKTGDLGYMDDEGYLFLEGRMDDVCKCSGEKVSTLLIEQVLIELDLFRDVAVLAVPDAYSGMSPMVFYVLKEDTVFDRNQLLRDLKERLPQSHVPHRFMALLALPRLGSGKLERHKLLDMIHSEESFTATSR